MTELAVIIVTWNVRDLALEALVSLTADLQINGPKDYAVYVVDNASSDGTAAAIGAAFPDGVHLITNSENLGFAAANNLALRKIGFGSQSGDELPRAVYLLNPDTVTQPGATRKLYDSLLGNAELGLVGAGLEYEDGGFQHSAFYFPGLRQLWIEFFPSPGRFYESRFNGRYARDVYESGQPFAVDFPLGATMMLRREVIEQTSGFDERFFMYCEEIDWAWRIHKAGWQVKCIPAARVMHLEGRSARQVRPQAVIYLWRSRLRLFQKHYPRWKRWLARAMLVSGMSRKIQQTRRDQSMTTSDREALIAAYRTVQRLALGRLPGT